MSDVCPPLLAGYDFLGRPYYTYYCDWNDTYYSARADCTSCSTMHFWNESIQMTKNDFVQFSALTGLLLGVLFVWAVFKAYL